MLHSIWNHQGPYRVTADVSSAPRASAWHVPAPGARPALAAYPAATRLPARTRPVAAATAVMRLPEPAHPLMQVMQQARPDLAVLIELEFQPMRRALLATVCLQQALRDLGPALPRAPHGLPGLPQVLLVHALATATGADAARAAVALAALRQLDPQREIARAWQLRGEPCAAPSPDSVVAWRVAMDLGATPAGMDVLQAVLEVPVAPARRQAFAALLQAARQLARESAVPATPVSMLRSQAVLSGAAGRALMGAAACLASEAQAVPASPRAGAAPRAGSAGTPPRLRSAFALSVPFSSSAMARWTFVSTSRPAARIVSAMSEALVRHVARPVVVTAVLPAPGSAGSGVRDAGGTPRCARTAG
jgi:hypothetical protein